MDIKNICTKKTYEKDGEERVVWLRVGSLKTLDTGKQYIDLNMWPNESFYVFEEKKSIDI